MIFKIQQPKPRPENIPTLILSMDKVWTTVTRCVQIGHGQERFF
ncbi:Hypothetical protein I595_274 [Croceitalea dokdonensis DOKDO 023]|uniref:Uncharacterized protein n=1 Tax=Croceitalea dokdonensis DOKDO 023 TaxID=1300341 RepID=A0A0P7A965_9FLAO|nr:Hypothetical protein I595_274 [Croceitalea dokdonensis DOKDO 023]